MDNEEIGRQIAKRRQVNGLSQESLAKETRISRNYISLIERGEASNISMSILDRIAIALGATPSELMGRSTQDELLIPPGLRELGRQDNLSFETVDKLARIPRRGREPKTVEEWRKLYSMLKKYLDTK